MSAGYGRQLDGEHGDRTPSGWRDDLDDLAGSGAQDGRAEWRVGGDPTLGRVAVPGEDQRVADPLAVLLEQRRPASDDGPISVVDPFRRIEDTGKDFEPTRSPGKREVEHAVVSHLSGKRGHVGSHPADFIDERAPGLGGHRPAPVG